MTKYKKEEKIRKDIVIISDFIKIFCEELHNERDKKQVKFSGKIKEYLSGYSMILCADCKNLLLYSAGKRIACQFYPKPMCKKCITPCYKEDCRAKIKDVMKFSGKYLLKKGRLDLLYKFYF